MTNGWRTVLAVAVLLGAPPVMAQQAQTPADMDNGGEPGPKFSATMDLEVFGKPVHVEYVDQCLKFAADDPKSFVKVYYAPRYGGFRIDTDRATVVVTAPHMCFVPTMALTEPGNPRVQKQFAMPKYGHEIFPAGSTLMLVLPKSATDTVVMPLSQYALERGDAGVRLISADAVIPAVDGVVSNVVPLRMRDMLERRVPVTCYLSWVIVPARAARWRDKPIIKTFAEAATEDVTVLERSGEMLTAFQFVFPDETIQYLFHGVPSLETKRWWIWAEALLPSLSHALAGFWTMPAALPYDPVNSSSGEEAMNFFAHYHPESLYRLNEGEDGIFRNHWDNDKKYTMIYKKDDIDVCDYNNGKNKNIKYLYDYSYGVSQVLESSVYNPDIYFLKSDHNFFMAVASRLLVPTLE